MPACRAVARRGGAEAMTRPAPTRIAAPAQHQMLRAAAHFGWCAVRHRGKPLTRQAAGCPRTTITANGAEYTFWNIQAVSVYATVGRRKFINLWMWCHRDCPGVSPISNNCLINKMTAYI